VRPNRERRHSQREMCSDFVRISWADQRGARTSLIGILEDVSPEGMCLNLETQVPEGQVVHVHTKGFEGEAEVRYCHGMDYGYSVGLEFSDGFSWDRNKWRPKHLLTLSR